jgi:hypothetical protein
MQSALDILFDCHSLSSPVTHPSVSVVHVLIDLFPLLSPAHITYNQPLALGHMSAPPCLSYPSLLCPALPYPTLSALPCSTLPCHTLPRHALPTILYPTLPNPPHSNQKQVRLIDPGPGFRGPYISGGRPVRGDHSSSHLTAGISRGDRGTGSVNVQTLHSTVRHVFRIN